MAKTRPEANEPAYEKTQILLAYEGAKRDVLSAILEDGKLYTKQSVETLLADILKKEVK